jgi:hypothetical protein
MYRATEGEILGGISFGDDDKYPASSYYHTDMSIYGNGSTSMDRDPYIPIENEDMGRDWAANEFDSTMPAQKIYPYHDVYDTCDPFMRKDYYLDSKLPRKCAKKCARERLMTNMPSFHSHDPMCGEPPRKSRDAFGLLNKNNIIIMFFILLLTIVYLQHVEIMELVSKR